MNPKHATEWVFAYGSNLHIQDLKHWLRHYGYPDQGIIQVLPAILDNYRLVWNYYSPVRKGGAANVEPAQGERVLGALLELTPETLPGIDRKEGHPKRYNRGAEPVEAKSLDEKRTYQAWVYEVQPDFQTPSPTQPTEEYFKIMLDGIHQVGLPQSWVQSVHDSLPESDFSSP